MHVYMYVRPPRYISWGAYMCRSHFPYGIKFWHKKDLCLSLYRPIGYNNGRIRTIYKR